MTIFTTIFLLLPVLLLPAIPGATDLVHQTCNTSSQTDPNIDFTFCMKAFRSCPSSPHANLTRLGLISINLLKHNVMHTTCFIKSLLEETEMQKRMKVGLKDCMEIYSDASLSVGEAARDYRGKRIDDANVKISSVMDDSSTCEDGFHDVGVASPLTKHNNCTFQLSAIVLSIMDMLPF